MAKKKPAKQMRVYAELTLSTSIPVMANSLEEALVASKEFDTDDFMDIKGEHNDSSVRITGIFEG